MVVVMGLWGVGGCKGGRPRAMGGLGGIMGVSGGFGERDMGEMLWGETTERGQRCDSTAGNGSHSRWGLAGRPPHSYGVSAPQPPPLPSPLWTPQDPEGKPKKASIRDNGDGTYTVSYVPDTTGRYTILIKYGGDEIPYSPYRIRAVPAGDASKCTVTGGCPQRGAVGRGALLWGRGGWGGQGGLRGSCCS